MKRFFNKGLLVLCFVFAFVATSMADDNTTVTSEPDMYIMKINYVWYDTGEPCYVYSAGIYATEVNTGVVYLSSDRYGNGVIVLEEGTYELHGPTQYWWGAVSRIVEVDCNKTITMEVWSE